MNNFLKAVESETLKVIKSKLTQVSVDFKTENLPKERGIYFIYKNGCENPVYIGCAHAKNRTIKKRCSQYLGTSKKGATFRNKVIKDKLKKEPIVNKKKNEKAIEEGIKYIQKNYQLKFVTVDESVSSSEILLLERACISIYNPKYND